MPYTVTAQRPSDIPTSYCAVTGFPQSQHARLPQSQGTEDPLSTPQACPPMETAMRFAAPAALGALPWELSPKA